jgi:thiamine pyrophosphate-dependent acetolactate synthase large subunit-like protein
VRRGSPTLGRFDSCAAPSENRLQIDHVLGRNDELNHVRWGRLVQFGYPEFAVELQPIDFAAVARTCGAAGRTLDDSTQAEGLLRETLAELGHRARPVRRRPE